MHRAPSRRARTPADHAACPTDRDRGRRRRSRGGRMSRAPRRSRAEPSSFRSWHRIRGATTRPDRRRSRCTRSLLDQRRRTVPLPESHASVPRSSRRQELTRIADPTQHAVVSYERDGFTISRGFATPADAAALLDGAIDLARRHAAGEVLVRRLRDPRTEPRASRGRTTRGRRVEGLSRAPTRAVFGLRRRATTCWTPCPSCSAARTSIASCRSSSSRTRARGASRVTRIRSTSRSRPRGRSSACGSRPPTPRSTTAASTWCPAAIASRCTHMSPTAREREPRILRNRRPRSRNGCRRRDGPGRCLVLRQPPHAFLDRQHVVTPALRDGVPLRPRRDR